MFRKILSVTISIAVICLQSNTLLSEILPPNSNVTNRPSINTHQTTLGTVPVVNIVNPNANGLSHNKYDKFNIDEQGAVLNNSRKSAYSQIIGETINANPNLTKTATVILNEVLTARSNIFGTLEVLGQKADIIIANAYGISVNGGKFINAGKVSLITGTPMENNINKYTIGTGNLEIGQDGLTNGGDINLVSSQMEISGEVTAKELQILTGNDEYDIKQNQISSQDNEDVTAIDISSSMYADKIKIISSKQDNKIEIKKNANLISNVEDIEIDAQGNINIKGTLQSNKDIKLNGETIANSGKMNAKNNITIEADIFENKSLTENLKYTKETVVTNAQAPKSSGEVLKEYEAIKELSYDKTAEIEAGNKFNINSNEFKNIGGTIKANKIEINSTKTINEISLDTVKIPLLYTYDVYKQFFTAIYDRTYTTEKEEDVNLQLQGEIIGKNIKITSEELTNRSSKIESEGKIEVKANNINNIVSDDQILEIKKVEVGGSIERGGYRILNKEIVETVYKPLPSEIIGKEISLQAEEIMNESSVIQASTKLAITGNNLTNTNKMAFYNSLYKYQIKGADDKNFGLTGWKEEIHYQEHKIFYPNIYTSKTEGKLIGNEIEINLTGKLSQEEYDITNPITRPNDKDTDKKTISSIEADKLKVSAKEIINSGMINTKNDLVIKTEQNFVNNDGVLIGGSIDINTGENFTSRALINYTDYNTSTFKIKTPSINAAGIILTTSGKLNINSQGDIDIKSTSVLSNDDITLTAQKISLQSLIYDDFYWKVDFKKSYGSIPKKEQELTGTMLSYGNVHFKGLRDIGGYNVIANKRINIESEEDIEIKNSQIKKYLEKIARTSGGTFGTSSTDIYKKLTIENIKTKLEAGEDLTIKAGNKITLQGVNITSDGTINLISEKDSINIVGVLDYEATEHSRTESGTLGLTGMSKTDIKENTSLVESTIKAKDGINISAGNDINILGSNILSDKDITIQALNNINIGSIKEQSYNYYHKETKDFNVTDFVTDLYSNLITTPFKFYSEMIDNGKYTLVELSYDISEKKKGKTKITNKASNIESKEKLTLKAGKEATIQASNITANEIENNTPKTNVISGEDKETTITENKETRLKVGFEISNAYLNAYKAVDNVTKAAEAQARAEEELSRIEELHKQGKASDKALKQARDNVTIARANIVFLTTMAAGAVSGAVSSYETLGFGVSGTATYETNETKTTQETITNIASNLIANKNILINADEYNQIGSNVASLAGDIFINANNANISASKDTFNLTTESKSYNVSATYGTNGTYGSVGYNQSTQEQYAEKHNNSQIQANNGKIEINTTGDTTLKGANIKGKDVSITAENLTVESLQDKSKTTGSSFGMNVGAGKSNGGISGTAGFESGNIDNESAWVNSQSSIIGQNEVNIKVKDTTDVKGAVIASESDNLTLDTDKLVYSDIKDYDTQNSSNIGINLSLGQYDNDSVLRTGLPLDTMGGKITLKEQGTEKEQTTKATIGKGKIIVGGQEQSSEDLSDLNRDTTNSQTITKDQITADLNAELNVDVKLLASLVDAVYNGDANKISVVKDYNNTKNKIKEIKQKIQEKLKAKKEEIVKQRKQDLRDKIKEQQFSANEEQDRAIKQEIDNNEEVLELQQSIDNLKIVEEYVKENNIKDKKEIEKYKRLAVENVEIIKDEPSGKLYILTDHTYETGDKIIEAGLERKILEITQEVLNETRPGTASDKLAEQINIAKNAIDECIDKYTYQGISYGLSRFSSDTDSSLPIAQIGFDILGMIPVVGVLGDFASYKISEYYNDDAGMFLSLVGMTDIYPQAVVVGTAGSVTKAAKDVAKSAKVIEKLIKTISKDGGKTAELAIKTAKKTEKLTKKADFYVKPTGEVIPATGYRYLPSTDSMLPNIRKNMIVHSREKPTYFSFDKFDTPSPNKLQVPHDASIRLEFDTLQIIDDIRIPYGRWGTGSYLEPITKDYFIYGNGGATQAITNRSFKINNIINLNKNIKGVVK